MTRFDGLTPVRTMAEFDGYLREELVPVLVSERDDFATLAGGRPSIDTLAPVLMVTGRVAAVLRRADDAVRRPALLTPRVGSCPPEARARTLACGQETSSPSVAHNR